MMTADVAVIGAGPAGMSAAIAAAATGARVVLIDEQPNPGGHLRWTVQPIAHLSDGLADLPGVRVAERVSAKLQTDRIKTLTNAVVWGLFEQYELGVTTRERALQLNAPAVIVATGSTDQCVSFPGWTLPGVMTARAVQIFLHIHRVLPGRRWAVLGVGPEATELIRDLELARAEVVVHVANSSEVSATGDDHVTKLIVDGRTHDIDAVALAIGRQPDPALALQAQIESAWVPELGGFIPRRSTNLETSSPGLYVVGDAAGTLSVAEAIAEGRLAGLIAGGADGGSVASAHSHLAGTRTDLRQAIVDRLQPAAALS